MNQTKTNLVGIYSTTKLENIKIPRRNSINDATPKIEIYAEI